MTTYVNLRPGATPAEIDAIVADAYALGDADIRLSTPHVQLPSSDKIGWWLIQFEDISGKWCNYPMLLAKGKRIFGRKSDAITYITETCARDMARIYVNFNWRVVETDVHGQIV